MGASNSEIDRHQLSSDDNSFLWARGPFDEGAKARIDGFGLAHAPSIDAVGWYAMRSWVAGWHDADAGILANGLSDSMPVTK